MKIDDTQILSHNNNYISQTLKSRYDNFMSEILEIKYKLWKAGNFRIIISFCWQSHDCDLYAFTQWSNEHEIIETSMK